MEEKFIIKNCIPEIILKKDLYVKDNTDVIISWIYPSIINGSVIFRQFCQYAGEQYYYSLLPYKDNINYCDSFTTHCGLLPASIVINSVMPPNGNMYNDSFFRISEVLKTYQKLENNTRFLTLTIPDANYELFIHNLILNLKNLFFLKQIRIIVESEKQYSNLKTELKKYESFFNLKTILKKINF